MTQKDYILRIAEDVGRALAQIIYHKEIHDYQGSLSLIDELFKQTVERVLAFFMPSQKRPC